MPEGHVEILEEIGKFRVLCHLQCCCWWLWFMIVMMIYAGEDDDITDKDDDQVPPCDLLAGQQHHKCSCCTTSSSLWGDRQEENAIPPKLNHLLFLSFLQGAQNLEYHGACRLAEFPRPHEGEIQKKYGGGAEKIYITNYCSQGDEKFSYFRQF